MTDAAQLIKDIHKGVFDDHLNQVIDACTDRHEIVRKIKAAEVKPGDEVRFVNLKPKYMQNIRGATLIEVVGDKAKVQLPESAKFGRGYGKYYSDKLTTTIPVSCMEPA